MNAALLETEKLRMRCPAECWSMDSTAPSAPENSSRCSAATAPASRCCCARWPDCAPRGGSVRLRLRHRQSLPRRDVAVQLGFLPQDPDAAPQGTCSIPCSRALRAPRLLGNLRSADEGGARALADVGLAAFGARELATLSGGEQRRAAIARLLVQAPVDLPAGRTHQSPRSGTTDRNPRSACTDSRATALR